MTTEHDENKEQNKTSHIQDHLNQLLSEGQPLSGGEDDLSKDGGSSVHTDDEQPSGFRARVTNGLRSLLTDEENEGMHLLTPAELKEMDDSILSKGRWHLPNLSEMERQGLGVVIGLAVLAGVLGFLVSPSGTVSRGRD